MKKILSIILTLAILVSSMSNILVFASDESTTLETGDTVVLYAFLSNNPGVSELQISFEYDSATMNLVKVTNGEAMNDATYTGPKNLASGCMATWYYIDEPDYYKDGSLVALEFEIIDGEAIEDTYPVSVVIVSADGAGGTTFDLTDNIAVIDYRPGDVNGDGIHSLRYDVSEFNQYIVDGCKYDPLGYAVQINENAGDVNNDGVITIKDVIDVNKYIVDGCVYDPNGYAVKLYPHIEKCKHTSLTAFSAKEATCTEDGNVAYWACSDCGKYFSDEAATEEIYLSDTIIEVKGHTEIAIPAVKPTETEAGSTEGKKCSVCGTVTVEPEAIAPLTGYVIEYKINEEYLEKLGVVNPNKTTYTEEDTANSSIELLDLEAEGYKFRGWSLNQAAEDFVKITEIPQGSKKNYKLYAHWEAITYDVTYKLYQTPLGEISDEKYLHFTTSKGLKDLPNPKINNYVFLGWYTDDGEEITDIPVGTSEDITLNAYWTSKRNLAKSIPLTDPIICEDTTNNVIYFAYELGTIENVPLSDAIWQIQAVSGLAQQKSETVEKTISTQTAESINTAISKATVDSSTWTLSKDWSTTTNINQTWAENNGMTVDVAKEKATSSAGTLLITSTTGGNKSTSTTDGTTTLTYDSKNKTEESGANFDVELNAKLSTSTEVSAKAGVKAGVVETEAGVSNTTGFEVGGSIATGNYGKDATNVHSGTDTTKIDTTVTANTSSWNKSSSEQNTQTASERTAVSKMLSQVISTEKGYGESYAYGGSGSEELEVSNTSSKSVDTSSSFVYSTGEKRITTRTYSTDGKSDGCYRLVIAGTVHVFGVVGYDVASNSYFTYTYSILDDTIYEFLDYAPDLSFSDCENGVLPFEIPYFVYEYVTENIAITNGLGFSTNSNTKTAKVTQYLGTDTDVIIPSYISSGNTSYKVTGIEPSAFAGKNIRSVWLSKFIDEIPEGAFSGCTDLEEISGYFTIIGKDAFKGCTSLGKYEDKNGETKFQAFEVGEKVTSIGTDAFVDVPIISVKACGKEEAVEAVSSGAKNIQLDISNLSATDAIELSIPEISSFTLQGGNKAFSNFKLESLAEETVIEEISIKNTSEIPLIISSNDVTLEAVSVESTGYSLILKSDGTSINLIRDTNIVSAGENAIISKGDLTFTSVLLSNVYGSLNVAGNVNVCGAVSGVDNVNVTNGKINAGCSWSAPTKPVLTIDKTTCYDRDEITCTWTEAEYSDYYNFFVVDKTTREKVFSQGNLTETEIVFDAPSAGTYVAYVHAINKILVDTGEKYYISSDETTLTVSPSDYTVTFNGNGGTPSKTSQSVTYNSTYGTLPTATKDYYNFLGWYTAASGGTLVTSSTKFTSTSNVTLYAHWELKPVSTTWVLKSEMPADAQAVNTKYTYAKTHYTTSSSSTMSGWTKYDTTWVWSDYGSWSAWQYGAVTETDSRDVETQQVVDVPEHTEYRYGAYVGDNNRGNRPCSYCATGYNNRTPNEVWTEWSNSKIPTPSGWNYKCYHGCSHRGGQYFSTEASPGGRGAGYYWHDYVVDGYSDVFFWEETRQVAATYKTQYRYRDRSKVYTYHFYKVEDLESTSYPTGDNISTINEWVQYREK